LLRGGADLRKAKRSGGDLISHRRKISSDARLIVALLKKQPQKMDELCKRAGVHLSTFYRVLPLLDGKGIIKETENGYVLWTFSELDWMVEKAFKEVRKEGYSMTLEAIAGKMGLPSSEIEAALYRIAKKYGMIVRTLDSGKKIIVKAH